MLEQTILIEELTTFRISLLSKWYFYQIRVFMLHSILYNFIIYNYKMQFSN